MSKKTLNTILAKKHHFLIQVKGNTSKLHQQVIQITTQNKALDTNHDMERKSGRNDNRLIEVFDVLQGQITGDWNGIKRIIKVYRWDDANPIEKTRARKSKRYNNKPCNGIHYYILSKPIDHAAFLGKMIRNHWLIENRLHWVKDVYLREDFMTITKHSPAALVAALNNIALNQIRKFGQKPCKDFFTRITNNVNELFRILRT